MTDQTTHHTPGTTPAPNATTPPGTLAPLTAPPPPPPPTPLDPPAIYYNLKYRVPPLVVETQEEADALDPTEWTTGAAPPHIHPPAKSADEWPKLYANVNVEPKIIGNADEVKTLGDEWREFDIPEDLIKSSQTKVDAKNKADQAKSSASKPGSPQPTTP